ncbi:MAG: hypothetical protein NZ960_01325 [Candidatus Kapabacteria bacterium]|nr:hypothetical protein [Candidatus Kapabacteria bacterium]MDW8011668.1 hypothetical protein [Bacteroidota bacterium]
MKHWYWVAAVLLLGCTRPPQYDDILRIRPEFVSQWRNALQDTLYGGFFVRGTAVELQIRPNPRGGHDTILLFRPAETEGERPQFWQVPVVQLQNIALRFGLDTSRYGGWDIVETYAVTERIPRIRSIPVRARECDCLPLGVELPGLTIRCPERAFGWYFLELRGTAALYSDVPTRDSRIGRLRYLGEVAAGVRLGTYREWGIGLLYSSGIPVYNSFRSELLRRPLTLLHVRYQIGNHRVRRETQKRFIFDPMHGPQEISAQIEEAIGSTAPVSGCIRPYLFAQLGASLDRLTLRMARFWLSQRQDCSKCVRFLRDLEASGRLPQVDFSLPITWGLGAGVEITLTPWIDLAADVAWRSIAIGEETNLLGFQNVPSSRRLNAWLFRVGVTF